MTEDSGHEITLKELARIMEELGDEQHYIMDMLNKLYGERKRMDELQYHLIAQLLSNRVVSAGKIPSLKVKITYSDSLLLSDISIILMEIQKAGDHVIGDENYNSNYKYDQTYTINQLLGIGPLSQLRGKDGHVPLRITECHTGHSIELWIQIIMGTPTAIYSLIQLYKAIKKHMDRKKGSIIDETEEIEEIEIIIEYRQR